MRLLPLCLALVLAACASPETPSEPAMERPDPLNPSDYPELETPPDWNARFDHDAEYAVGSDPDSSDVYFVTMTPGWHVTTKPAGIFWHPGSTADGSFRATATIHLFDPADRNEGYGLFFGGTDLEGPAQAYLYFLVRRSGEFLVKRRAGEETAVLVDWTGDAAIVPYDSLTDGTSTNTLAVAVESDSVRFFVNDARMTALARAGLVTDGFVGLRFNHGLNTHTSEFKVEPLGRDD